MATNKVLVELVARDLISNVVGDIKTSIDSISGSLDGVDGTVARGTFFGNLATGVYLGAVEALGNAIGSFKSAVGEAMDFETSSISAASGLAATAGLTLNNARELTKEFEKQAAINAAALPGDTSDFIKISQAIGDNVAQGFNLSTESGMEAFKEAMNELTRGIGFTAANSSNPEAVSRAYQGYIQGTKTMTELTTYDEVAASPLFKTLQDLAKDRGIGDVKALSVKERIDLLEEASKKALTPEVIAAFSTSLSGMVENVKTMLFNVNVGVFGLMREVEGQGGRSAFDVMKAVFVNLTEVANSLGALTNFKFDPMDALISFMDGLNYVLDWMQSVADLLDAGNYEAAAAMFNSAIKGIIEGAFSMLGGMVNGLFRGLLSFAESFDWRVASASLAGFINNFIRSVAEFIWRTDWSSLGGGLVKMFQKLILFVGATFAQLDWLSMGRMLFNIFAGLVKMLGGAMWGSFTGMVEAIIDVVQAVVDYILDTPRRMVDTVTRGALSNDAGTTADGYGINEGGAWLRDSWNNLVSPLTTPTGAGTNNSNTANMQANVNVAGTNATPQQIAGAAVDALGGMWQQFTRGALA